MTESHQKKIEEYYHILRLGDDDGDDNQSRNTTIVTNKLIELITGNTTKNSLSVDSLLDVASWLCTQGELKSFNDLKTKYANCSTKSMCSNVWKSDTYIYKCIDCQFDENCALCVECFQPSKHVGHRYRLLPSFRGCCDCGDISAWKREGWCDFHGQSRVIGQLPISLHQTIKLYSSAIVQLIHRSLSPQKHHQQSSNNNNNNNNVNSPPPPPPPQPPLSPSSPFVSSMDESMQGQQQQQDTIQMYKINYQYIEPLMKLVKSMNQLIDLLGDNVALICASSFTDNNDITNDKDNHKHIYLSTFYLLAESKEEIEPLERFVISLFVSNDYRDQLSIHLSQNYDIVRHYDTEGNISKPFSLTVQLFTVDSIALKIVSTQNFIHIVNNFNAVIKNAQNKNTGQLIVNSPVIKDKHYFRTLVDICYILRNKSSFLWLMENPEQLFETFKPLTLAQEIYSQSRIATVHIEQEDDFWHYAFNFEFYLRKYLLDPVQNLILTMSSNNSDLIKESQILNLKNHFLEEIENFYNCTGHRLSKIAWKRGLRDNRVPDFRVNKQPVSIHLPLHRSLIEFIYDLILIFKKQPKQCLFNSKGNYVEPSFIVDPIIRLYVFLSQVKSGSWVRNGTSVLYQSHLYLRHDEFCQPDFYLLQFCLLCMETEQIYAQLLDRSELTTWFVLDGTIVTPASPVSSPSTSPQPTSILSPHGLFSSPSAALSSLLPGFLRSSTNGGNTNGPPRPPQPQTTTVPPVPVHQSNADKNNLVMAEDLVALIISLVSDRSKLAGFTTEQIIRRDLIHILAIGNSTHSDLVERHHDTINSHPGFDRVLESVAIYHNATVHEKGKYQLRDECWEEWDAYYPLYSRVELQKAEENYSRYFKNHKKTGQSSSSSSYHRPIHPLVPAIPILSGIEKILHCDILHSIIFTILYNSLSGSPRTSEALVTNTLHLISLVLNHSNNNNLKNNNINNNNNNNNSNSHQQPSVPKYETIDFGFHPKDFVANMFHPIKQSGYFMIGSASISHTIYSLLNTMLTSSSNLEQHTGAIELILGHPLVEQAKPFYLANDMAGSSGSSNSGLATSLGNSQGLSKSPEFGSLQKEFARKKQLEIMKKFSEQQRSFLKHSTEKTKQKEKEKEKEKDHSELLVFGDIDEDDEEIPKSSSSSDIDMDEDEDLNIFGSCSMCKEEMNPTKEPFGYVSYIQKNQILSFLPLENSSNLGSAIEQVAMDYMELFKDINRVKSSFINFCSHLMHLECHKKLLKSQSSHHRAGAAEHSPLDSFHCPCCRRISNTIIPFSDCPIYSHRNNNQISPSTLPFIDWAISQTNQQFPIHTASLYTPGIILQELIGNQDSPYKLHLLWNIIISTITITEISKRGSNILDSITHHFKSSLQNLVKLVVSKSLVNQGQRTSEMNSMLNRIFNNNNIQQDNNNNNNGTTEKDQINIQFLNIEMFGLLVRMFICTESLPIHQRLSFSFIVQLLFISTIIQSIIVLKQKNILKGTILEEIKNISNGEMNQEIKSLCLPFLRRTGILLSVLDYPNTSNRIDYSTNDGIDNEYQYLLKYLGLSNESLMETLNNNQIVSNLIIKTWIDNTTTTTIKEDNNNNNQQVVTTTSTIYPPLRGYKKFEFVNLPREYIPFFLEMNKKECDECHNATKKELRNRIICMFCRKIMCSYTEYIDHYASCSGIGVSLLLSESLIVILFKNSIKIWGTVYLDEHGDEDIGLRRGKPLFLSTERLERLKQDILSLSIQNLTQSIPNHNMLFDR
ncbi:hypothetical protein DFA_06071 [Cavenderia fasciculata]|uniref:E3 ubiquitin-protein ligase n=1 Tax=Cavenderia fasciculata TaxID=261658 RepID=F4PK09_CACFS|nr:uncharacterized protein DFA_06071 [Cavenderia fasciculata]EGG23933.1 hypothetical protein DFA_06071 [Cavenderia fasciculata]|eukprot:XP_004361784.1 hypothetical protein DFA_06071 [Cavenderia fasciculata]